VLKIRFCFAT